MARISKEQLLAAVAKPIEYECEPLGGSVLIQPLTAAAMIAMQDDFQRAEKDPAYKGEFMSRLVASSLVNEDGTPQFTASELGSLGNLRGEVMLDLFGKVMEANGLAEADSGN